MCSRQCTYVSIGATWSICYWMTTWLHWDNLWNLEYMISGNFFYFLFVILGNVEASAAARFLSRFAVRGLLASTKAVIMDLKQCLNPLSPKWPRSIFSSQYPYTVNRYVMRINKMISQEKMPWSIIKFSQLIFFLRKCMEISLENLHVDTGA